MSPKALNSQERKPEQKEAKQNPKEIRFHTQEKFNYSLYRVSMVAVTYYYLVAQNNTHLLAYRPIVQKSKMGFTGPQSSCWQSCIHSFLEVLGENLFPGLFQLL